MSLRGEHSKVGSTEGSLKSTLETGCFVVPESVFCGAFSHRADGSGLRSGQRGSRELLIQGEGFARQS